MTRKIRIAKLALIAALFFLVAVGVFGAPIMTVIPEGEIIYAASNQGIMAWNVTSGKVLQRIEKNLTEPYFVKYQDRFYVITDSGLMVYDCASGAWKEIENLPLGPNWIALDSGSKFIYLGFHEKQVVALNLQNESDIRIIGQHNDSVVSVAFDNTNIYSATISGEIKIWDKKTWLLKSILKSERDDIIWRLLARDNKVYAGNEPGSMEIWDADTSLLIKKIKPYQSSIRGFALDDKNLYTSAFSPSQIDIWTLEGDNVAVIDMASQGVKALSLAVDSRYIYVGLIEGAVLVYDKNTKELAKTLGTPVAEQNNQLKATDKFTKKVNPVKPVFIAFAIIFIIFIIFDIFGSAKKKHGKLTKSALINTLQSYVSIKDIFVLLGITSILILLVGLFNQRFVFPYFVPHIKVLYYFDALVRRGGFLPVWFILLPCLGYWLARKSKKKIIKYSAALLGLALAVAVYLVAPRII